MSIEPCDRTVGCVPGSNLDEFTDKLLGMRRSWNKGSPSNTVSEADAAALRH